jgi:hypothetical protein
MENKEDLDTELKKIQLQREQLSLKHELEKEQFRQWILDLPKFALRVLVKGLLYLKTLLLRMWRPIAGLVLVLFIAAGINTWQENRELEEAQIASNRFYENMNAHVEKTCGKLCSYADGGAYISTNGGTCEKAPVLSHLRCKKEAETNYRLGLVPQNN